jgi:hypothetical protein
MTIRRKKPINQRNCERTDGQRPQRTVGSEKSKLDVPGARRDKTREENPADSRVRRRPRIRDHEKGEEQQRAVFQTMNRDRQWLAEPDGSTEHQRHVEADERVGDVASACPVHNQTAETRHQECEECDVAPLAGGHPYISADHHQRDDCDVGRIEEMLAVQFDEKLARNRDRRSQQREGNVICAQQEAQRQPGDECTSRIERRQMPDFRADVLSQQRC